MNLSHTTPLTLVFGTPERQRGLDAILRITPDIRPLPRSGGRHGRGGDAVMGFGSVLPREIWCVCPTLADKAKPTDALRLALWRGMQRAAMHDHLRIGIALEKVRGVPVPWTEVCAIAIRTAQKYFAENGELSEFRLVSPDAEILNHTKKLMEELQESE